MVAKSLQLAISIAVPMVGGMLGGIVVGPEIKGWYSKLKKPRWTPPNIVFPLVWPVLYCFNGIASFNVLRSNGEGKGLSLVLYGLQMALNFIWSPLFFKAHRPDLALVNITVMLGLATAATATMSKAASPKQILPFMVPYLAWLSYATALNVSIVKLNPNAHKIEGGSDKDSIKMNPMPPAEKKST